MSPEKSKKIDFHIHLTAWGNLPSAVKQNYVESFPRALDAAGLDQAVLFSPDNELTARVVARAPERLIPFVFFDPRLPDAPDRLEQLVVERGFQGLKISSSGGTTGQGRGFYLNDESCFRVYERAQSLSIPVLIHTGMIYCNPENPTVTHTKYCQPIYLDDVARAFPDLKIIAAHGGRPFVEQTLALSLLPNVYVDISWSLMPLSMWPEMIRRVLEAFGPNRLIYGSDANWREPERIQTRLAECLRIFQSQFHVDQETENKILGLNALRILNRKSGWKTASEAILT